MPISTNIVRASRMIWQAFRPLFICLSLLLLASSLIVGVRSFFRAERWDVFLLHPTHDGGWCTEDQLEVSRGEADFVVTTEFWSDPDSELFAMPLGQTPTFAHNPPQNYGSGTRMSVSSGLGFDHSYSKHILPTQFSSDSPDMHWFAQREWMAPCWALLALGLPGIFMLSRVSRRHRRDKLLGQGRCIRCAYDLRGSGLVCPECGAARLMAEPRRGFSRRSVSFVSGGILLLICAGLSSAIAITAARQQALRAQYEATEALLAATSDADVRADDIDTQAVRVALGHGADVAAHHSQPLRGVAAWGDAQLTEELIRRGANVNDVDASGFTALYRALQNDRLPCAVVLLEAGASLHVPCVTNTAPFHAIHDDVAGHNEMLRLLLDHHVGLSGRDQGGCTPLLWAVLIGDTRATTMLLDAGADPNEGIAQGSGQHDGQAALHVLALEWQFWEPKEERADVMRLLLAHHANINARDAAGRTPLHLAVSMGVFDLATRLVQAGADLSARDRAGDRPVDALPRDETQMRPLLTPKPASPLRGDHDE